MTGDVSQPRSTFDASIRTSDIPSQNSYRTRTPPPDEENSLRSASPSRFPRNQRSSGRSCSPLSRNTMTQGAGYDDERGRDSYTLMTNQHMGYEYERGRGPHDRRRDSFNTMPTQDMGYEHDRGRPPYRDRQSYSRNKNQSERRPLTERPYYTGMSALGSVVDYKDKKYAEEPRYCHSMTMMDPSYRVAVKGAASTDYAKATMPKYFTQPLTCFYWHKNGFCTKRDEECLYAHNHTGVVASAPVTISSSKGAVAGRNAKIEVDQLYQRERELNDGEARLSAKEMDLNGKLAIANRVEAVLATVTQAVAEGRRAAENASSELVDRSEELKWMLPKLREAENPEVGDFALDALEGALAALSEVRRDLACIAKDVESLRV